MISAGRVEFIGIIEDSTKPNLGKHPRRAKEKPGSRRREMPSCRHWTNTRIRLLPLIQPTVFDLFGRYSGEGRLVCGDCCANRADLIAVRYENVQTKTSGCVGRDDIGGPGRRVRGQGGGFSTQVIQGFHRPRPGTIGQHPGHLGFQEGGETHRCRRRHFSVEQRRPSPFRGDHGCGRLAPGARHGCCPDQLKHVGDLGPRF